MKITLAEALHNLNWDKFCDKFGYSVYAVKEGGGDVLVEITPEEYEELK